jgi:hypothetical protein
MKFVRDKTLRPLLLLGSVAALCVMWSPSVAGAAQLPQDHTYQKTLRQYLGSLTPEDLAVEQREFRLPERELSDEEKHRLWTLTLLVPPFDVGLPADQFVLGSIEGTKGIMTPNMSPEGTAWLASWDSPINPYHGDPSLKRRAFVWCAVDMMMLDHHHQQGHARRSDFLGGTLIWLAYTYEKVREVLPEKPRAAYETGLRKMVRRLEKWGPTGAMTDMDLFAPVGLFYAARALEDPEIEKLARDYSRPLFTHPRFFHPAGYFVDTGGFDASYNGISLFFAGHAAAATRWDFAIQALERAYELRGHLILPEPKGRSYGPSHFSPRTSAGTPREQWNSTKCSPFSTPSLRATSATTTSASFCASKGAGKPPTPSFRQPTPSGSNVTVGRWASRLSGPGRSNSPPRCGRITTRPAPPAATS